MSTKSEREALEFFDTFIVTNKGKTRVIPKATRAPTIAMEKAVLAGLVEVSETPVTDYREKCVVYTLTAKGYEVCFKAAEKIRAMG